MNEVYIKKVSVFEQQLIELAEIRNPAASDTEIFQFAQDLKHIVRPSLVRYPWRQVQVEMLPPDEFFELKTSRNRQLITAKEQKKLFYDVSISIAGMSVGSSLLYGLVGTGIGQSFVLADFDTFSTSNLNRVQATVLDIGANKATTAKQRALEMNPYLTIDTIKEALTADNLEHFFAAGKTNLVFEEIDDFKMKVIIREEAQRRKIPVVMLTNLGDGVLIDIERYDLDDTPIFNGLLNEVDLKRIKHEEQTQELMKEFSLKLIDNTMVTPRALETLRGIGSEYRGRPQLYSTVALDGGVAPYLARRIIIDNNLQSGRYKLELGSIV